jgi:hypothetical protein
MLTLTHKFRSEEMDELLVLDSKKDRLFKQNERRK